MNPAAAAELVLYVRRAIRCPDCDGTGRRVDLDHRYGRGFGSFAVVTPCSECNGVGYVTRHVRAVRS
jgi:DnaJ-class molecular chaperone